MHTLVRNSNEHTSWTLVCHWYLIWGEWMIMQVSPRIVSHNTKLDLFSKSTIVSTVAMHLGTTHGQSALSVLTHLILPEKQSLLFPYWSWETKSPTDQLPPTAGMLQIWDVTTFIWSCDVLFKSGLQKYCICADSMQDLETQDAQGTEHLCYDGVLH